MIQIPLPKDDCESFFSFFIGMIEPGEEFHRYFNHCVPLVIKVVTEDRLPERIADRTSTFLREWLPTVITKTANCHGCSVCDIRDIVRFYEHISPIIPWAVAHDIFELFPAFPKMFDLQTPLAKSKSYEYADAERRDFLDKFVSHEFLTIITIRLAGTNASLPHFTVFLLLLNEISGNIETGTVDNLLATFIPDFLAFLKRADGSSDVIGCVSLFVETYRLAGTTMNHENICHAFFVLADSLLGSESRLLGAGIFNAFAKPKCPATLRPHFERFSRETGLLERLFTGDAFDPKLFSVCHDLLVTMAARGNVTPRFLATVWRVVRHGGDLKDLFKALLVKVSSDLIHEFLFESPGPEFVPFVCDLLLNRERERDDDLARSLLQALVVIGNQSPSLQTVLTGVAPVCRETAPNWVRHNLLDLCMNDFRQSKSLFCLGVIQQIYEHDSFMIGRTFTVNLCELLQNSKETRFVLDVCVSFLDLGVLKDISDDFVLALKHVTDWEAVWHFFEKVDHNKFSDAALNKLFELLQGQQFERSPKFLRFVAVMIEQVNRMNGKVRVFQEMGGPVRK
jgi:hypothetical protein